MSFFNQVPVGTLGRRMPKRRLAVLATVVSFLSIFAGSMVLEESRWEFRYVEGGDEHSYWDPETSNLFISGYSYVSLLREAGSQFVREGTVSFRSPQGERLHGGPIAFDGRWVFVGTSEGALVAIDYLDFPRGGSFSNLSYVGHGGPVYLGGITTPGGLSIRAMALFEGALFVSGTVDYPDPGGVVGVVLALDVEDPATISMDRSSVKVLYSLTFQGEITDLDLQDGLLYVLEWTGEGAVNEGRMHVVDVSVSPPVETKVWSTRPSYAMDIEGAIVAIVSAWTNSISLYDVAGNFGRSRTLPGIPVDIRLDSGRAYVSWFLNPFDEPGLSILSTPDLDSSVNMGFDRFRIDIGHVQVLTEGILLVSDRGMAVVTLASRPAVLVNGFVQTLVLASGIVTAFAAVYWTPPVDRGTFRDGRES